MNLRGNNPYNNSINKVSTLTLTKTTVKWFFFKTTTTTTMDVSALGSKVVELKIQGYQKDGYTVTAN